MHNTDAFLQEIYARELNSEFENVKSTEGVNSAQAATAALYKDWLDIRSEDVSTVQKGLSNLFASARAQKAKLEMEKQVQVHRARESFEKYYKQGEPRNSDHQADLTQICQI